MLLSILTLFVFDLRTKLITRGFIPGRGTSRWCTFSSPATPSSTAATLACGALCSGPLTQVVHINSSIIVIIIAIIIVINIFNIDTAINIINLNSCSIDNLAVAELLVAAGAEV